MWRTDKELYVDKEVQKTYKVTHTGSIIMLENNETGKRKFYRLEAIPEKPEKLLIPIFDEERIDQMIDEIAKKVKEAMTA